MKRRAFSLILVVLSAILLAACGKGSDISEENNQSIRPQSEDMTQDTQDKDTEKTTEDKEEAAISNSTEKETENMEEPGGAQMQKIMIDAGGQSFQAVLYDNETAKALKERLPMTFNMEELHGNEKFYYLEEGLPTDSKNVGNIQTGDIMLFGSDCLVLFFDDFNTSYSYTRIGQIEDAQGFAEALESGTVEVTFRTGE
ncbi:MAG: cyclophilin-like fold protein [Eubacteriales bacterium]|nr:cyclophilin-like fold protein [Eubacteriales bacterium]